MTVATTRAAGRSGVEGHTLERVHAMFDTMTMTPVDRVLPAKIRLPPVDQLVTRPRLIARIDAGTRRPLTLVTAPAGSGKTSLLAAWARATTSRVAWLSLDECDNDPTRFVAGLAAAVDRAAPGLGISTRRLLDATYPPPAAAAIGVLAEEIEEADRYLVVAIDDVHLLVDAVVHEAIEALVAFWPPRARVILAGRAEPPLPIARMRARNQLSEVTAADLRFTADKAARGGLTADPAWLPEGERLIAERPPYQSEFERSTLARVLCRGRATRPPRITMMGTTAPG